MLTVHQHLKEKKFVLLLLLFAFFSCSLRAQVTFNNSDRIDIIQAEGEPLPGSPYPSEIAVSGLSGTITGLTVSLHGFTHNFPSGIDILLVAPDGTNTIIMSDAGGAIDVDIPIEIVLDDAASSYLPDEIQLVAGTFKPTNLGTGDTWPLPAPSPSGLTAFSTFNGINPNGTWSLYLVNDDDGSYGSISGWSLSVKTQFTNLPVKMVSFTGTYIESQSSVLLRWTTAQEMNSRSFLIETSVNGFDWKLAGSVKAAGTTDRQQNYQYTDAHPVQGRNYYRLRQEDIDGRYEYSKVVMVNAVLPQNNMYLAYNSPGNLFSVYRLHSSSGEKFSLLLFDMSGKVILKRQEITGNASVYTLDLQNLKAGMYIMKFLSGSLETTQKLLVAR
jgi:hypothetical protein